MNPAGALEIRLCLAQSRRKREEHIFGNKKRARDRLTHLMNSIKRGLAAKTTTGIRPKLAGRFEFEISVYQCDIDDVHQVRPFFIRTICDSSDRVLRPNDSFRPQQSHREIEIVARRPHRYRDALTVYSNL